jgi:hypothetical protein
MEKMRIKYVYANFFLGEPKQRIVKFDAVQF